MRVKLQLVMCHDDGHEETITDVITLTKNNKRIEPLGLTLSEAKHLLSTTQHHLLRQQVDAFLDTCSECPDCGTPLQLKSRSRRSFRTVFGTLKFSSPRLAHCSCKRRKTASFRPLSALLTASVSPELLSMEAKGSSLASYGMSLNALKDFLPLDRTLDVTTVRYDTRKVAKRLEAELGDEHRSLIAGDPRDGHLVRHPQAPHILDWFHLTMKLTVLGQFGKGLVHCEAVLGEERGNQIERLTWSLWHGQVDKALSKIDDLKTSIEPFSETYARFPRLVKALSALRTSIVHNRYVIPNDSERYHNGEAIATGCVESTVNEVVRRRFCKKQQMQWSKEGAHVLLQTRVRTLNGALGAIFKRWYPDMDLEVEEIPVAA